jgi:hypothetical protein
MGRAEGELLGRVELKIKFGGDEIGICVDEWMEG